MSDKELLQNKTEKEVLRVYQKVNPSMYPIEEDPKEYRRRMDFMEDLFLHRLNFPPKMFKDATLLDFGTGTGENSLFYLVAGASCTFVEMNQLACQRAEKLFKQFSSESSKWEIVNESIFDFNSDESYDIVISNGVIHTTSNKEKAIEIKSKHLKNGGFLVLGIANSAGSFQRNLQRAILYHFATSDEEIASFAEELFADHLDRAEKFSSRDREAIIYDSYVNPKLDTPSVSEILNWFSKNGLVMYSAWPPIIPAILGDPADRKPLPLEDFPSLMSLAEIIYLSHSDDDAIVLAETEKEIEPVIKSFKEIVDLLSDVTPDGRIEVDDAIKKIDTFQTGEKRLDPYLHHVDKLTNALEETKCIIEALKKDDINGVKKCIANTKVLFKGTHGLGMNWYIGYKP